MAEVHKNYIIISYFVCIINICIQYMCTMIGHPLTFLSSSGGSGGTMMALPPSLSILCFRAAMDSRHIYEPHMAGEYHESDFDWDEHAKSAREQLKQITKCESGTPPGYGRNIVSSLPDIQRASDDDPNTSAASWESFHARHSSARFFSERRYLLRAFPELLELDNMAAGLFAHAQHNAHENVVECTKKPAEIAGDRKAVLRNSCKDGSAGGESREKQPLLRLSDGIDRPMDAATGDCEGGNEENEAWWPMREAVRVLEVGCGTGSSALPLLR